MKGNSELPLSPPRLFRLQDVRLDLKKLFTKLGEAVVKAKVALAKGDPTSGMAEAVGAIVGGALGAAEAISYKLSQEELAWRLVHRALTKALGELVEEWLRKYAGTREYTGTQEAAEYITSRIADLEIAIEEADVRLDLDFFENPTALPVLRSVRKSFVEWFRLCGASEAETNSVAVRLNSYFAVALHDEWRSHSDDYQPLLKVLSSPFAAAERMERYWTRYQLSLRKQFNEPVFEECFGLSEIYVPLRATYRDKKKVQRTRDGQVVEVRQAVVVDLGSSIEYWLQVANKDDAIRLIRGGPGSGKSSFAKKLAHDVAAAKFADQSSTLRDLRVLFLPLQRFRIRDKLTEAVGDAMGDEGSRDFSENPLKQKNFATEERRVFLIFDGLDELSKPGDLADEETRLFLTELRAFIERCNTNDCRVLCLVTGRTAVVQAHRDILRLADNQELEVLPFLITKADIEKRENSDHPFCDPSSLLCQDQRYLWWEKYAACNAGEPSKLPDALEKEDVLDLSAEPLLLYLLVLSGYHRRPDRMQPVNRNEIYASLFEDVANRRHAGGKTLASTVELKQDFIETMEIIATAAWYGDGRAATVEDIRRYCPQYLKMPLERFLQSDVGMARLVAAFYFQHAEPRLKHRNAFEFTHKSFGEYLVARRIVRTIKDVHEHLEQTRRLTDPKAEALKSWFDLTCHKAVDFDLLKFLRDEIQLCAPECVKKWLQTLSFLFNRSIQDEMPVTISSDINFRRAEQQARNAEEALLVVSNACAKSTNLKLTFDWHDNLNFGNMIYRLCGQRPAGFGSVALASLSNIKARGADLNFQNLGEAELCEADLSCANLRYANLRGANLRGADLSQADLRDANLREADLYGAKLQADLRGADLTDAKIPRIGI